ncbi:hypothetical protein N7G274_008916 [Stereocaulon virgatum]|uniref:Uncharacterized protein n=1 Tax=Stereocaulon virgatum TaxID=373712 RepID=A0ABR4A1N8_9LECA
MPPLRRYLRITQYTVLEVRIYLDNPADTHRWLLNPQSPMLPRVIEAVRPLVLPKLREENDNAKGKGGKGKGGKKRGWKDVVVEDNFDVAVFLTETSTRHSILRKEKQAMSKKERLGTTNGKMTGTRDAPVEVGEDPLGLRREDSDEIQGVRLADLPAAGQDGDGTTPKLPKEESGERLFVSDGSEDEGSVMNGKEMDTAMADAGDEGDDKKKLALNTTYDGFNIYGRILCLVVKRKGTSKGKEVAGGSGQAMMEEWISSTQMGQGQMMDE